MPLRSTHSNTPKPAFTTQPIRNLARNGPTDPNSDIQVDTLALPLTLIVTAQWTTAFIIQMLPNNKSGLLQTLKFPLHFIMNQLISYFDKCQLQYINLYLLSEPDTSLQVSYKMVRAGWRRNACVP